MKFGILGIGMVARAIGARLVELGHDVMVGTRNAAETIRRTERDRMGNPPFSAWLQDHSKIRLGTFAEAAVHGETVVNATSGAGALEAVELAGAANLDGKVLIDVSNPLDFSRGMPPILSVVNTDSLGEQIQRAFPRILDLGDITTARGPEMYLPLWLRLWGAVQSPMFSLKVVR